MSTAELEAKTKLNQKTMYAVLALAMGPLAVKK
jgi:hypothetical protein